MEPGGEIHDGALRTTINGASFSSAGQNWDAAGRRTGLAINGAGYNLASRADGALIYAANPTGSGSYNFDTAGLLTGRTVGNRSTSIASRDGEGRPLAAGATARTGGTTRERCHGFLTAFWCRAGD